MGGLILLMLSIVMALASFLAGALPLSNALSHSQLRLLSSIGIGILVGTSLIVIIPEGIESVARTGSLAVYTSAHISSQHNPRSLTASHMTWEPWVTTPSSLGAMLGGGGGLRERDDSWLPGILRPTGLSTNEGENDDGANSPKHGDETKRPTDDGQQPKPDADKSGGVDQDESLIPTFNIGLALMLGFVAMFLIDRVPRHAADRLKAANTTRHVSLDDLASSSVAGDDEAAGGLLGSLAPSPRQSRSLATTTGLVIHATADGIAMGASAATEDMKLGFIIFFAIMIHKAPAALGLTSVLLKQGLSKRAARGHLVVFSLAAPVGALTTYIITLIGNHEKMGGETGYWWTGMLLLFSAGTFLYVAMHAMQEDKYPAAHDHSNPNIYADIGSLPQRKHNKPQVRDTIATMAGMLLPMLMQFGHHH